MANSASEDQLFAAFAAQCQVTVAIAADICRMAGMLHGELGPQAPGLVPLNILNGYMADLSRTVAPLFQMQTDLAERTKGAGIGTGA